VSEKENVIGTLVWSLRTHSSQGGYYSHQEGGRFKAYHFPGTQSNEEAFGELGVFDAVR
jgi:hypothetical protein